jgi:hypothetical protein
LNAIFQKLFFNKEGQNRGGKMNQTVFYIIVKKGKTEEGKKGRAFGSVWNKIFQKFFFFFLKKKGKTEEKNVEVFKKSTRLGGW